MHNHSTNISDTSHSHTMCSYSLYTAKANKRHQTQCATSSKPSILSTNRPTAAKIAWAMDASRLASTGEIARGKDKGILKRQNKQRRKELKSQQPLQTFWTTHSGNEPAPIIQRGNIPAHRGEMYPTNLAAEHPAGNMLKEQATVGCPVDTGRDWTHDELQAAVNRGPHSSALDPDAIAQYKLEIADKVKSGQAKVHLWSDIKKNPPAKLKISPFAMIPHKSRKFRGILDLSFPVTMPDNNYIVEAVNATTKRTAPQGGIDQIGNVLPRIIAAMAEAEPDEMIYMAKFDIKDGFWRLVCEEGAEWNFAYVMPQEEGEPEKIVVPQSLQMGWIQSPMYFGGASETGRDVAAKYANTKVGQLPEHKFIQYTKTAKEYASLPTTANVTNKTLKYMLEVYVDDFLGLVIPRSAQDLDHVANALMHGIHDVFPEETIPENDPISLKKLKQQDGEWALNKELLGWDLDGKSKTIQLNEKKTAELLRELKIMQRCRKGIPFEAFRKTAGKARNAALSIPAGKALFTPINTVLSKQPKTVYIRKNSVLQESFSNLRTLLREAGKEPTHCRELVTGPPDGFGIVDAAKEGTGGIIMGEADEVVPTVFRLEWPESVRKLMQTQQNMKGTLTNSDLELAGMVLLFCVMEAVMPSLKHKHVALFNDNTPAVSWTDRMASKSSKLAGGLLRALALRMRHHRASPLTPLHIRGVHNSISDIPSRSFGGTPKWHFPNDLDFLTFFNSQFPLPNQHSWQLFQVSKELSSKLISALVTGATTMAEWQRLPPAGKSTGGTGVPTAGNYEWTLTFRTTSPMKPSSESSQDLQEGSEEADTAEAAKLQLLRALRQSQPLARRSPWTQGDIPSNRSGATSTSNQSAK